MAGPTPTFFFAPGQLEKRNSDWGSGEPMRRVAKAFAAYVEFTDQWLDVRIGNGPDALAGAWDGLVEGNITPATGLMRSLKKP
jgi:hypothetical protein